MLGLLVLLAAAPAPDASRILVVAQDDAADTEALYAGLGAAGLLPVELDERAGVDRDAPPAQRPAARDDARAHVQEARGKFRELDLDAARAVADVAVDEVLRLDRPEDAADVLVDALLLKATIALQSGADDDARTSLALVARLDPTKTELNPGLYPPSLCEAYVAARAAAVDDAAAPDGSLVVKPRVAAFQQAELLVDFQAHENVGELALRAGPHVVTARAPGDVPYTRVIVVRANETTVLAPFLAPRDAAEKRRALVVKARAAKTDGARKTALAALADLCAARAVLFVGKSAPYLWSPRGLDKLAVPSSSAPAALGSATLSALQAPVKKDGDKITPPPGDDPPPSGAVVVGGVVGGVVAGAAALAGLGYAAYYLFWPGDPPPPPPPPVVPGCCIQ